MFLRILLFYLISVIICANFCHLPSQDFQKYCNYYSVVDLNILTVAAFFSYMTKRYFKLIDHFSRRNSLQILSFSFAWLNSRPMPLSFLASYLPMRLSWFEHHLCTMNYCSHILLSSYLYCIESTLADLVLVMNSKVCQSYA